MAEISPQLPPERISLLQHIMNIVVFKQETRQLGCDVRGFRTIAEFLLDLIKLKANIGRPTSGVSQRATREPVPHARCLSNATVRRLAAVKTR
jgi:hypothetical protein